MKSYFTLLFLLVAFSTFAAELTIVEQDFNRAVELAEAQDKLVFVDFYTTWCGPCKKLDKSVFQDEVTQARLGEYVVLLRYDAERDTMHHLSKKYHIRMYPTGLLLSAAGGVVDIQYGFRGEDKASLTANVMEFVMEGKKLSDQGIFRKGYSAEINEADYPDFYSDYVDRVNTKLDRSALNRYLESSEDKLSESHFSIIFYFSDDVDMKAAEAFRELASSYSELFGKDDVETTLYLMTSGMFGRAIESNDSLVFEEARSFAKQALSKKDFDELMPNVEMRKLEAQGKWKELIAIHDANRKAGDLSNGYANHISWQVYKDCEDKEVMKICLGWMKEVVAEEIDFDYLDTYAFLLVKAGESDKAAAVAKQAIAVGKEQDRKVNKLKELVARLEQ